ncbi:translation initiation factor IF-2 subunit beta [Candidatus Nanohaloarchaea archaeon]|nr:translation initiation factor IF-2 subunit beta [Candidatus Nanohaloarchaea archaeon]
MDYDDLLEKGREEVSEEEGSAERFEMPEVKSRKKGSNTAIENFSEIADKLGRDEKHLSKHIQSDLGTSGQIEGSELVLNGEFRRGHVQSKVEDYAEDYVICPECNRPDTKLTKEKGVEILKCQACGARTVVE